MTCSLPADRSALVGGPSQQRRKPAPAPHQPDCGNVASAAARLLPPRTAAGWAAPRANNRASRSQSPSGDHRHRLTPGHRPPERGGHAAPSAPKPCCCNSAQPAPARSPSHGPRHRGRRLPRPARQLAPPVLDQRSQPPAEATPPRASTAALPQIPAIEENTMNTSTWSPANSARRTTCRLPLLPNSSGSSGQAHHRPARCPGGPGLGRVHHRPPTIPAPASRATTSPTQRRPDHTPPR